MAGNVINFVIPESRRQAVENLVRHLRPGGLSSTATVHGLHKVRVPKTVVKTVVIPCRGSTLTSGTLPISYAESWWAAVDSNHVPPR